MKTFKEKQELTPKNSLEKYLDMKLVGGEFTGQNVTRIIQAVEFKLQKRAQEIKGVIEGKRLDTYNIQDEFILSNAEYNQALDDLLTYLSEKGLLTKE